MVNEDKQKVTPAEENVVASLLHSVVRRNITANI